MESNSSSVFNIPDDIQKEIQKQEEEKLYTLIRGEVSKFDETTLKRLQDLLLDKKMRDLEGMIGSAKLSRNFGGDYHSIYFRVNKPITLTSLGFWGPFENQTGQYNVKIVISEYQSRFPSINLQDENILNRMETYASAGSKSIFVVPLTKPTPLNAYKWIRIRFQLNGPDTCICSSVKGVYRCEDSKVDFDFIDSSHQLPILHFTLS